MTKSTAPDRSTLVVAKRLWHAGAFFEPGHVWADVDTDNSPVADETVQHYLDTGFLQDRDVLEKARNAEAYAARQDAASKDSRIAQLEADLQAALDAQAGGEPDLSALRDALPEAKTMADVAGEVASLQAEVKTLRALHAGVGGTALPGNFVGRGNLVAFGLDTYESLRGKSAAQLDAIEGLTLEKATDIVAKVEKHFKPAG